MNLSGCKDGKWSPNKIDHVLAHVNVRWQKLTCARKRPFTSAKKKSLPPPAPTGGDLWPTLLSSLDHMKEPVAFNRAALPCLVWGDEPILRYQAFFLTTA